jgi:hypothetical protein
MRHPLPVFAIDRTGAAPQVGVELGSADKRLERADLAGADADEGALHVEIAEALRHEDAQFVLRRDRAIRHHRTQRRIGRHRHPARARRCLDHPQVLVVDIAEHRAAAEGVAAPHWHGVNDETDLVEVESTRLHAVAEFIQAERAVGLDVEPRQRFQHLEAGDA